MDLTTISVVVTIVAGAISIIQGLLGLLDRLRGKSPKPGAQRGSGGVASPAPAPPYAPTPGQPYAPAPVQTAQQERTERRFGTHPWIALGIGLGYLLYALGALLGGLSNPPDATGFAVFAAGGLLLLVVWVAAIVRVIQLRRWGWLIAMILGTAVTAFVFGIVGPSERRA